MIISIIGMICGIIGICLTDLMIIELLNIGFIIIEAINIMLCLIRIKNINIKINFMRDMYLNSIRKRGD